MHQRRTTKKQQPCIGMNASCIEMPQHSSTGNVALHKNNNDNNPATTNGDDGIASTTIGTNTTTNTTTIAYGNSISTSTSSKNVNNNINSIKRRKRRVRINSSNFEFSIHRLLLPLIIIFCILWIRMFYMIGSRRSLSFPLSHNNENHAQAHNHRRQQATRTDSDNVNSDSISSSIPQSKTKIDSSKFQLVSNQAPSCNALSSSSSDEIDITLVTQLSHDRLWMMKHHCERYGPNIISIAVYTNNTLDEVITELVDMGCRVQANDDGSGNGNGNGSGNGNGNGNDNGNGNGNGNGNERRDDDENMEIDDDQTEATPVGSTAIVSVVVLNAERHGTAWNDYPVNELRNLALRAVRTTHIIYIDIDFWTSNNLYDTIVQPQIKQQLYNDPKLVLVIPAFQLRRTTNCTDETKDCRNEHVPLMPHKLKGLSEGIKSKRITIFDPTNRGGHGSTDYTKWFQQPSGSLYPIDCLKSHRYEPFVVIRYCNDITPPFQSIFSGYGKNKMTWMMQVVRSGFIFSQLGGVYVIHYPHKISSSRIDWNNSPKRLQQQQQEDGSGGGSDGHQNYNVRRPKQSDGDTINFNKYKRGQTDILYIEFKNWLEETIPSTNIRVPMCDNAQDDDNKLWIDPNLKKWK
jgi:hypothetical protein